MRVSVRIYNRNGNLRKHLNILRKETLHWQDEIGYYYIERNEERLYIEYRKYTRDFKGISDIDYVLKGVLEIDLVNGKMTQYSHFASHWKDEDLLNYLGVEFLFSDLINNYVYNVTFYDFVKALFGDYTNPIDILKVKLVEEGISLQNFPMSEFKKVILLDKRHWQNKVSHYSSIFYYMKHCLDLTMFFKHITMLKKMVVADMFSDAENLGYKVNMRWSYNRMKLEHDNWSYEIRDKRLLSEDNEHLKTGYTYPTIDGAELLKSKFELVYEGQEMHHCVGGSGYWEMCVKGICAIYKYQNKESKHLRATIEIRINPETGEVSLNQMQRKGNRLYVPEEIKETIRKQLKGYKVPEVVEYNKQLHEIY